MEKEEKKTTKKKLRAKKDFIICQNDFYLEIKEGDTIDEAKCKKFLANLKTEKVI